MQTEKSELEGKRIMPETSLSSFRHCPFTLGFRFLRLHRRPELLIIFLPIIWKNPRFDKNISIISFKYLQLTFNDVQLRTSFVTVRK